VNIDFERALGAYLGLACGDALGAPVEFMTRTEILARHGELRRMVGGGWLKLAPGQITDDTQMALALARAIIAGDGFDATLAAEQFAAWLQTKPIDVGNTCRRGIRRYMLDGSLSGPPAEGDAGNGACMRNLPLALATLGDAGQFARATLSQCHLTHHHVLSDAATVTLGAMTQALILGEDLEVARAMADDLVARHRQFRFAPYPGRASAYIVDTVQTVLHCLFTTTSFEECVVAAVNQGDDADTNGAIAGMLAGARYGRAAIPRHWTAQLEGNVAATIEAQTRALIALSPAAHSDAGTVG